MKLKKNESDIILAQWQTNWRQALSLWSKYTKLREPIFCDTDSIALKEGLTDSFAMIRLRDQTVVINFAAIRENDLVDLSLIHI